MFSIYAKPSNANFPDLHHPFALVAQLAILIKTIHPHIDMSLQEKLSAIEAERQQKRTEEAEKQKEKELDPIRQNIKSLEDQKKSLELIAGSLAVESGKDGATGKGMKEYSTETMGEAAAKEEELRGLLKEHRETLSSMGVNSKEDLLNNEELSAEPEVASYIEAQGAAEGLAQSDEILQKQLESLGVKIDPSEFSYARAENAIEQRLAEIGDHIIREKLKTPEGHQEVIEEFSAKLAKDLPEMSRVKAEKVLRAGHLNGDRQERCWLEIAGQEVVDHRGQAIDNPMLYPNPVLGYCPGKPIEFRNWRNLALPISSSEFQHIKERFGGDVAREAVVNAYQERMDKILNDTVTDNLEPGEQTEAHHRLKEFKEGADRTLGMALDAKFTEQQLCEMYPLLNQHTRQGIPGESIDAFKKEMDSLSLQKEAAMEALKKLIAEDGDIGKGEDEEVEVRELRQGGVGYSSPTKEKEAHRLDEEVKDAHRALEDEYQNLRRSYPGVLDSSATGKTVKSIEAIISAHEKQKPKLFSGGWAKEREALNRVRSLAAHVEELKGQREKINASYHLPYGLSSYKRHSEEAVVGEAVFNALKGFKGTKKQMKEIIRESLRKIADRPVPAEKLKLYQKYQSLAEKL